MNNNKVAEKKGSITQECFYNYFFCGTSTILSRFHGPPVSSLILVPKIYFLSLSFYTFMVYVISLGCTVLSVGRPGIKSANSHPSSSSQPLQPPLPPFMYYKTSRAGIILTSLATVPTAVTTACSSDGQ